MGFFANEFDEMPSMPPRGDPLGDTMNDEAFQKALAESMLANGGGAGGAHPPTGFMTEEE